MTTQERLRTFLISRGEKPEQIAHVEQHIMTLATTSANSYDSIAFGLVNLLTESDDAPALATVDEATHCLEAMIQAHASTGASIGEVSEAMKQIASVYSEEV